MTDLLAVDNAPHREATGWRRNEELIDALAYVDSLTPAERAAVDKLIAEEVVFELCANYVVLYCSLTALQAVLV